MGKANKVKYELRDSVEMVDLVQTLKDVADNKYFSLASQKDQFRRFGESFAEFFRLISLTKAEHPLIKNDNDTVGLLVVTIEGSFLGQFNNSIIRRALEQREMFKKTRFIAVGDKAVDQLSAYDSNLKLFAGMESVGYYETAIGVKDFLVDEIMNNRLGRVIVCHSWPKSFEVQKTRVNKLLPCVDLLSKQAQYVRVIEDVIEESESRDLIGYLSNLWLTTRLYEILIDTTIASAAAQSSFLEERVDKLRKDTKKIHLKYQKARKGDIDKSLRETFTARMLASK